jgi:hypothetical protein
MRVLKSTAERQQVGRFKRPLGPGCEIPAQAIVTIAPSALFCLQIAPESGNFQVVQKSPLARGSAVVCEEGNQDDKRDRHTQKI